MDREACDPILFVVGKKEARRIGGRSAYGIGLICKILTRGFSLIDEMGRPSIRCAKEPRLLEHCIISWKQDVGCKDKLGSPQNTEGT